MEHAYLVEVAQFVFAMLGLCFNVYGLREAKKDLLALVESGLNGSRRIVAMSNLQQELARLVVQFLLVFIGAASLFTAPPFPSMPDELAAGDFVTRVALMGITLVITMKSYLDVHDRKALMIMWLKEHDRRQTQVSIPFEDRRQLEGVEREI